jgi:hypothetical protein
MNTLPEDSLAVLAIIRRSHNTAVLSADEFAALAQAILFYLKGGHSHETAALLAAEECIPNPPRVGQDHETGRFYLIR